MSAAPWPVASTRRWELSYSRLTSLTGPCVVTGERREEKREGEGGKGGLHLLDALLRSDGIRRLDPGSRNGGQRNKTAELGSGPHAMRLFYSTLVLSSRPSM